MIQETVERYRAHLQKLRAYEHAMGLMSYDMNTIMPKGAGEIVGETLGILSEEGGFLWLSQFFRLADEVI